MKKTLLLTLYLLIAMPGQLAADSATPGCTAPGEETLTWIEESLELWDRVASTDLGLDRNSPPWIVYFDGTCSWNVNASQSDLEEMLGGNVVHTSQVRFRDESLPMSTYTHSGQILLPEGGHIPPRLILFASTYGEARASYMVMALPEIWRTAPRHADEPEVELDRLIRSVFVHEMTHTQQSPSLGSRLDTIINEEQLPDDEIDDDIVQRRFEDDVEFSASIDKERALFFDAATTDDAQRARDLAAEALALIRSRHASWFVDEYAYLGELEDIFLYMEGTANWAAFQALLAQGLSPEDALPFLRRGGRSWTQDEGLALFLAIDRLLPGWQTTAMSDSPGSVLDLIGKATENAGE